MKLTRKTALWVGGVTPLAVLMILLSLLLFGQSEDAASRQKHTALVLGTAETFLSNLKDAETGQRGYLLTGDETYLEPYLAVRHQIAGQLAQLRQLTRDNTTQQHRLEALTPLVDDRLTLLQQSIVARRANNTEDALKDVRSGQDKKLMDAIRTEMTVFIGIEHDLLAQHDASFYSTLSRLRLLILASSTFIGVLSLVSAFVVYRETRQRTQIQEVSDNAIAAAHEALRDKENTVSATIREQNLLQAVLSEQKKTQLIKHSELVAREKTLDDRDNSLLIERKKLDVLQSALNDKEENLLLAQQELLLREQTLHDREVIEVYPPPGLNNSIAHSDSFIATTEPQQSESADDSAYQANSPAPGRKLSSVFAAIENAGIHQNVSEQSNEPLSLSYLFNRLSNH